MMSNQKNGAKVFNIALLITVSTSIILELTHRITDWQAIYIIMAGCAIVYAISPFIKDDNDN